VMTAFTCVGSASDCLMLIRCLVPCLGRGTGCWHCRGAVAALGRPWYLHKGRMAFMPTLIFHRRGFRPTGWLWAIYVPIGGESIIWVLDHTRYEVGKYHCFSSLFVQCPFTLKATFLQCLFPKLSCSGHFLLQAFVNLLKFSLLNSVMHSSHLCIRL